ncbi:MAG: TIGR01440 family protein [Clostridia bacterium]|nr:TIGR01440 family protein [Clostridia bacterium]
MTEIINQANAVAEQLITDAHLKAGDIVVVGCSSSEITGGTIGKNSSAEVGRAVFETLCAAFSKKRIFIAAQCCEHLNRAIIIEREAAKGIPEVNVRPMPKAGGSFATAAYELMQDPVAIESLQADAGIDIGDTLIGMHLKPVAVPLRTAQRTIGSANVVCARTRPKFIGGIRAQYNEQLL